MQIEATVIGIAVDDHYDPPLYANVKLSYPLADEDWDVRATLKFPLAEANTLNIGQKVKITLTI